MNVIERELSWKEKELQFELEQLERERHHLSHKQKERTLTRWELKRVQQIVSEHTTVLDVLKRFSSLVTS